MNEERIDIGAKMISCCPSNIETDKIGLIAPIIRNKEIKILIMLSAFIF